MRILHLITHLRLGAGRAIVDLAIEQSRTHDVQVLLADNAEGNWRSDEGLLHELAHAGIATAAAGDFFHRAPAPLAASVHRLRTVAGAWDDDTVVHAHTAIAGAIARWAGAPRVVVTCHGWNTSRPAEYDLQDALAFSLADVVVSPSRYWAAHVESLPGAPRTLVVPNGFDLARYPRLPRAAGNAGLRIACVGELTARKGQDVLLDAMPDVWRRRPDAELHFFGEGDQAGNLRLQAERYGAHAGRIFFHGHVTPAYDALTSCDVFCLPSRSDNQPVAIIEAMLAELPIVSTIVGGIPEMIEGAGCGLLVRPDAPAALGDALSRLADPALRTALGRKGRAFAEDEHHVRASARTLSHAYTRRPSALPIGALVTAARDGRAVS